ncbi:hypothetical protein NEAUS04_0681 [Nematocida ausubeli]|nr:hypothetical protein NEAUS07_0933 [Nematocida ausubeli]KAI5147714.1 hypothetical protein NEAUS05_1003 [Nematocida ausubeli]KAI5161722.1 hypothetical protein NEAUS04_0681 [Nematocida ausubeli]
MQYQTSHVFKQTYNYHSAPRVVQPVLAIPVSSTIVEGNNSLGTVELHIEDAYSVLVAFVVIVLFIAIVLAVKNHSSIRVNSRRSNIEEVRASGETLPRYSHEVKATRLDRPKKTVKFAENVFYDAPPAYTEKDSFASSPVPSAPSIELDSTVPTAPPMEFWSLDTNSSLNGELRDESFFYTEKAGYLSTPFDRF